MQQYPQGPQYPYQQQPPQPPTPMTPQGGNALTRLSAGAKIGLGITAGILALCMACGLCSAFANIGAKANAANTSTGTSTSQQQPQHTVAAPTATATKPQPTTTTTTTTTPLARLQQVVSAAHQTPYTLSVAYTGGDVIVTEDVGQYGVTKYTIQDETFRIEQAVWTQWAPSVGRGVKTVNVNFTGPVQDQYGNTSTGVYAHAAIYASTAPRFNWSNLDGPSAWNAYDEAFIRSDI